MQLLQVCTWGPCNKSNSDIGHSSQYRTENLLLTYKKYVQNTMQANKRLKNTYLLKKLVEK